MPRSRSEKKTRRGRTFRRRRRMRTRKGGTGPIGRASGHALELIAQQTPTRSLGRFAQTSRRHQAAAHRELQRRKPPWLDTEAPVPLTATLKIGMVPNFESLELTEQEAQDILELNDDESTTVQDLQARAMAGYWRDMARDNWLDGRDIPVRTVRCGAPVCKPCSNEPTTTRRGRHSLRIAHATLASGVVGTP